MYIFYFMGYNPLLYLFLLLELSYIWPLVIPSGWFLCSSPFAILLWASSLLSNIKHCKLILICPGINHSSKSSSSFYWRMVSRKQGLDTRCSYGLGCQDKTCNALNSIHCHIPIHYTKFQTRNINLKSTTYIFIFQPVSCKLACLHLSTTGYFGNVNIIQLMLRTATSFLHFKYGNRIFSDYMVTQRWRIHLLIQRHKSHRFFHIAF